MTDEILEFTYEQIDARDKIMADSAWDSAIAGACRIIEATPAPTRDAADALKMALARVRAMRLDRNEPRP